VWGRSIWGGFHPAKGRLGGSICGGVMFNNSMVGTQLLE